MTAAASAQRGKRVALAILLPAVFLLGWELLGRNDLLVEGLIPTPTRVLQAWWVWIFGAGGLSLNPYSGTWAANLWFSLERVGEGYLLAIVLGVPVGVLIGWSRLAARPVQVYWLDTDHDGILHPPVVNQLAASLRPLLDEHYAAQSRRSERK